MDVVGSSMALWSGEQTIAERNQEINRRRMERNRGSGGPLKVTDPHAFAKLMRDMKEKSEQRKKEEEEREEERKRREGSAYRTPEQRRMDAEESRKKYALEEGEAGDTGRKFDPTKNYYKLLGIDRCASRAEIKAAYKKLALQYHPDKQRDATPMQREAINDHFKQLIEAYDVLMDDTLRECYEKAREYMRQNPGATHVPLSEEEQRIRTQGIAEFSRLRRQKGKIHKNAPTEKLVWVSMEKMHGGCTKTVEHTRRRIDEHGFEYSSVKHFHIVVRKGSRDGIKHEFENEGDESVDTLPGDLTFVLRTKPHPKFRRSGLKNLETVGMPPHRGDVWAFEQVTALNRKVLCCTANVMEASLLQGGKGGIAEITLEGQGCFDPEDPWGKPAGDLKVRVRYPPLVLHDMIRKTDLVMKPAILVPSSREEFPASVAGAILHKKSVAEIEALEMDRGTSGTKIPGLLLCLNSSGKPSKAAEKVLYGTPCIAWSMATLLGERTGDKDHPFMDEELVAASEARVVLVDMEEDIQELAKENSWKKVSDGTETGRGVICSAEARLREIADTLLRSGMWQTIFLRLCRGTTFVGVGHGCSLAGMLDSSHGPPSGWFLLPHVIRIGGDEAGWGFLHAAVYKWGKDVKGFGAAVGSLLEINPYTGIVNSIVVPPPETLIKTAAAVNAEGSSGSFRWHEELEDEEDEGFPEKCSYKLVAEYFQECV